jgi:hypothetical protein
VAYSGGSPCEIVNVLQGAWVSQVLAEPNLAGGWIDRLQRCSLTPWQERRIIGLVVNAGMLFRIGLD